MKIIHTADIHFDSPFSGLDTKKAAIRRDDIRKTFSRMIDLVKEENADILIIAGDLFDGGNVSKMTLDFIVSKFAEIPQTRIFIAAGNHDPKNLKSYYNLINWGENVHIFDTKPEIVKQCGLEILGVSFEGALCETPLISAEVFSENKPDILVMHSNLAGKDYNPVSRELVEKSGALYFASGHVHKNLCEKIGNTLFCYPGCLEGRGFDELGEKGVYVVNVEKSGATAEFKPLCTRQYKEIEVNISGQASYEGILGKIMLTEGFNTDNLYKIILYGECDFIIDERIITDALSAFHVKVVDKTTRKIDLLSISEDYSIKGLFVKKILEKMETEGETEELKKALAFGLAAISGEKVNP